MKPQVLVKLNPPKRLCQRAVSIWAISAPYYRVVIVVLLKDGNLEAVQCESGDVFSLAQARDAGICGIFQNRADAETYIDELRDEQKRNRWDAHKAAHSRRQSAS